MDESDIFWNLVATGHGVEEIDSMGGRVREADLVVVGRITALRPGEHVAGHAVWLLEETMPSHRRLLFLFYVPAHLARLGQSE